MENEKYKIDFIATLPAIQSAISIDGLGDGARIKLDVPRQCMGEILKLQMLTGKILKVNIEEYAETNKLGELLD